MPMQPKRGPNKTIIGAIGSPQNEETFQFLYQVTRRTAQVEVRNFLEYVLVHAPVPSSEVLIVCDNHSSHHSRMVTDWAAANQVEIMFLPPYSSVLNPCERVWAAFKTEWAKQLAKVHHQFRPERLHRGIERVLEAIHRRM